jgi:hypothetical protein
MNEMVKGRKTAAKLIMPMITSIGMLRNIPIITGIGATNMINIHLKKLIIII